MTGLEYQNWLQRKRRSLVLDTCSDVEPIIAINQPIFAHSCHLDMPISMPYLFELLESVTFLTGVSSNSLASMGVRIHVSQDIPCVSIPCISLCSQLHLHIVCRVRAVTLIRWLAQLQIQMAAS